MKKHKYSEWSSRQDSRQDSRREERKKKAVYVQKGPLQLNSSNEYLRLTNADALYRQNLFLLKSTEYQLLLRKLTADYSLLLLMNTQEFFTELASNSSLRLSLESCLVTLPRRDYQRRWGQVEGESWAGDQHFRLYELLMESILLIYHRISKAPSEYKQLVYDEWLLDIPKLLDLAALYAESNAPILRDIVANLYKVSENYDGDTVDFLNVVGEAGLMERGEGCVVDLRAEKLVDRHYSNKEAYLLKEATKRLFTVKDMLLNLTNFLTLFPRRYAYELATDYRIQERIVDGLTTYLQEVAQWNLAQHAVYFKSTFEDVRQSIAKYFLLVFHTLSEVFQQELPKGREGREEMELRCAAEDTYLTFCLMLSEQQSKPNRKSYAQLINILLEETESTVFFLTADKLSRSTPQFARSIDYCRNYEQRYRLQKRSLCRQSQDYEQIYATFKAGLANFTTLYAPAPSKADLAYRQQREAERVKRELNAETYVKLDKLRYLYLKAYDDEPEEEDEFNRVRLPNDHDFKPRKMPHPPLPDMSFAVSRPHNRSLDLSYSSRDFETENSRVEGSFLQDYLRDSVGPAVEEVSFQQEDNKIVDMSYIGQDVSMGDNAEPESEEILKELTSVMSQGDEADILTDLREESYTLDDLDLPEDLGLAGEWQNIDGNMSFDF